MIPALNIMVALYAGNEQSIVDAPNSAAFFRFGVQDCIADHCHQDDFGRLADVKPGETRALVFTDKMREYTCIRHEIGRITDGRLSDSEGVPVYKQNPGGLCIYTCTGKTKEKETYVHLTYWREEE